MPKIVDPDQQREGIRRAALEVFAREGLGGAGLVHVARAAGMGRSSLYHYYPDKAALVADLVDELLAAEEQMFISAAESEGSASERLESLAAQLTSLFEPWSALGRVFLELQSSEAERFRGFFRRIRRTLAGLITEGQQQGAIDRSLDATHLAATLIGAIDGLLLQHCIDPRAFRDREALTATLVTTVRKVLRP
jgi:AcrR family transcriptional regulator